MRRDVSYIIRFMAPAVCLMLIALMAAGSPAFAASGSPIDDVVASGMNDAMLARGIGQSLASKYTSRYHFIGIMMANKASGDGYLDADELLDRAESSGRALGDALAVAYDGYGSQSMHEVASLMLLSSRAGISPDVAAELFTGMAEAGYELADVSDVMVSASECVRALKPEDSGAELIDGLLSMASASSAATDMSEMTRIRVKREIDAQRELLEKKEAEWQRLANRGNNSEGRGTGDGGANGSGGGIGGGGGSNSAAGSSDGDGGGASGGGNNGGGNSSGGNSSGSGSEGNGNSGGGASGGANNGGGNSSGGNSGGSGSEGNGNSGGGSSGGANNGDGGSGGNNSGGGSAGGSSGGDGGNSGGGGSGDGGNSSGGESSGGDNAGGSDGGESSGGDGEADAK